MIKYFAISTAVLITMTSYSMNNNTSSLEFNKKQLEVMKRGQQMKTELVKKNKEVSDIRSLCFSWRKTHRGHLYYR